MILRSTGVLAAFEVREVVQRSTGKSFEIPTATVRVNDFVETDLSVSDALTAALEGSIGEYVDLIVDVTASGGFVRAKAVGIWPAAEVSALHSVAV